MTDVTGPTYTAPAGPDPRIQAIHDAEIEQYVDDESREAVLAAADAVDPYRHAGNLIIMVDARVQDLTALVDEILGTFEVKATMGRPVVRSAWQNAETVDEWRRRAKP